MIFLIRIPLTCDPAKVSLLELFNRNSFLSIPSCCLTRRIPLSLSKLGRRSVLDTELELTKVLSLRGETVLLMEFNSPISMTGIFLYQRMRMCLSEDFHILNTDYEVDLLAFIFDFLQVCELECRKGFFQPYSNQGQRFSFYSALIFCLLGITEPSWNLYLVEG